MLTRVLSRSFAVKFKAQTVIAPSRGYIKMETRAEIAKRIETPNIDAERESERRQAELQKVEDFHFSLRANDSNPSNFLQNIKLLSSEPRHTLPPIPAITSVPDSIWYRRPEPNRIVQGRLGRCKGSVKRISPIMRKIIGKHIDEALFLMQNDRSRAARRVHSALKMVRSHAIQKRFHIMRLYVREAITNRQRRVKGIRYHAKMKRGLEKRDWCSLVIRLEEKPIREFFRDLVSGNAPVSIMSKWKSKVMSSKRPLVMMRKYAFVLTAKGRQQRREMIKRKAYSLQQKLKVRPAHRRRKAACCPSTSSS
jgi:ribosomal protein L22